MNTPMQKLVKYLDERAGILSARMESPTCLNRDEQAARLAEIDAVRARLAVLEALDESRGSGS